VRRLRIRAGNGRLSVVALALAASVIACGGDTGGGRPEAGGPRIHWSVRIDDPREGTAHVVGRLSAYESSGALSVVLGFPDLVGDPSRLIALSARTVSDDTVLLPPVRSQPGKFTLDLAGRSGTVSIRYTIDPTYFPPGSEGREPSDARSRIAPELAITRTTSLLPQLDLPDLEATADFVLPKDWVAVTPWAARGDTFLIGSPADPTVDYLALGPFELAEAAAGDRVLRIATTPGRTQLAQEEIISIFRDAVDRIGVPPTPAADFLTVIVVPPTFMRGGAAGRRSIVQSARPEVLAHEMFHWWNHSGLTTAEATWFREGLTNYYGIELARESGAWSDEAAKRCLADLQAEMRYLEREGASSLAQAARAYRHDSRMRRLVYSKGTMFSMLLARELAGAGRKLDEAVRALLTDARQNLGNHEIRRVMSEVYGGLTDETFDRYVIGVAELPALELGVATGQSGCARFLPDREGG
jgi:hypothetical protein